MPRGHVTGIGALFDEHPPLACRHRLHHDLRVIPVGINTIVDGEEQRLSVRQDLRPVGDPVYGARGDEDLRCSPGSGYLQDAFSALSKDNRVIGLPACAPGIAGFAQGHGCPAADGDFPQLAICPKANPLPVGREERTSTATFGAADGSGFHLVHGAQVKLLVGAVGEEPTVRRESHDMTAHIRKLIAGRQHE